MKDSMCPPSLVLSQQDWQEVSRILTDIVPDVTVWAFGSRVSGTSKPYSDLDLVIVSDHQLTLESLATLKDAFDESDLTIKVDVVDWSATSTFFREIILKQFVVLQSGRV